MATLTEILWVAFFGIILGILLGMAFYQTIFKQEVKQLEKLNDEVEMTRQRFLMNLNELAELEKILRGQDARRDDTENEEPMTYRDRRGRIKSDETTTKLLERLVMYEGT